MTYPPDECSHQRAVEEEIQSRSNACCQEPPCRSMTDLQGECSHRRAEEEKEIQRGSSACCQEEEQEFNLGRVRVVKSPPARRFWPAATSLSALDSSCLVTSSSYRGSTATSPHASITTA